jgi:hypothetical protein
MCYGLRGHDRVRMARESRSRSGSALTERLAMPGSFCAHGVRRGAGCCPPGGRGSSWCRGLRHLRRPSMLASALVAYWLYICRSRAPPTPAATLGVAIAHACAACVRKRPLSAPRSPQTAREAGERSTAMKSRGKGGVTTKNTRAISSIAPTASHSPKARKAR